MLTINKYWTRCDSSACSSRTIRNGPYPSQAFALHTPHCNTATASDNL